MGRKDEKRTRAGCRKKGTPSGSRKFLVTKTVPCAALNAHTQPQQKKKMKTVTCPSKSQLQQKKKKDLGPTVTSVFDFEPLHN